MPSGPISPTAIRAASPEPGVAAMRLLARETRVSPGCVPREWGGSPVLRDTSWLDADSYLLRTDSGLGFMYRRGQGIVVEHDPGADLAEESLWLNGSVYAAVASINGLMPIHASAVAHCGRIYAFTGPSGVGKSTLVAGLARLGLPMYGDDMLVLDLSDPGRIVCLPGHKRLKLTSAAIALTGAAKQEAVGSDTGKFYAGAPAMRGPSAAAPPEPQAMPLPLAELVFLETGDTMAIEPVIGGARIARLDDDHYTTAMFIQAQNVGRSAMFALRARLARQLAMSVLVRPRDITRFAELAELAACHVRGGARAHGGAWQMADESPTA